MHCRFPTGSGSSLYQAGAGPVRGHRGHGPFGAGPFGMRGPLFAEALGGGFGPGPFGKGRARRGDVRAALLALLAERPMHGYEMIQELESRTHGLWRPSPGSVYPTLQLLEDEGLVEHEEEERGKRRYRLSAEGQQLAEQRRGSAPWEEVTAGADPQALGLRRSLGQLAAATAQVLRAGTPTQREEADAILTEARRRIYGLLAREET
jgi:DNA-binding PadR family transcriptional regulator